MNFAEDRDFRDLILESEVEECCGNVNTLYWKYSALSKRRFWWQKPSWKLIYLGNDEYWRRTIVIGPLVIALWTMLEGILVRKKILEALEQAYEDSI